MPEHTPPLVDQAFQRLRRDVLTGTFAANAKLKVEELQEAYGFSSSPLREALSRLAQEGLVRADERRGFRVAPITADDFYSLGAFFADVDHYGSFEGVSSNITPSERPAR